MKQTFTQIAQNFIENQKISDSDYRTILYWFGNSSLYFPTEQEKERALSAFLWMYQNCSADDCPEQQKQCAASFSERFSLPLSTSEQLLADFICNSNTAKPVVIAIEGLDGSGKTVQAKKLSDTLKQCGKKVCLIDFPQYSSFFGKEIGALLSGTGSASAMDLDEKSMCLWYALDRWKTVETAQIEQYDYVIFNRYTLSNVVYQTARKYNGFHREFADWIFGLEHAQLHLPAPDIYLYLDTRTEFCGENVLKKGERDYVDGLDVYEKSQDLLACCHSIYQRLSAEISEITFLECIGADGKLKSVDEISANIISTLTQQGLSIE